MKPGQTIVVTKTGQHFLKVGQTATLYKKHGDGRQLTTEMEEHQILKTSEFKLIL